MWRAFLSELDANGVLDWEETFIDASLPRQEKGRASRKDQEGKGTKHMVVVDGKGIPLGNTDSASPAEVRLAEKTLQQIRGPKKGREGRGPARSDQRQGVR